MDVSFRIKPLESNSRRETDRYMLIQTLTCQRRFQRGETMRNLYERDGTGTPDAIETLAEIEMPERTTLSAGGRRNHPEEKVTCDIRRHSQ
ncbi:hypothetical protein Y032_0011g1351 [Ancylostoma ceylanicum]|uniref:Uncharacterized protein n=1 Tax=Ancylostoma ceylanicum TaxID=53326 RepID=A0A016VE78_9BILA|nr:hypothetical protein Y032_0011g1351 [Ancylostoma ceylanicum]